MPLLGDRLRELRIERNKTLKQVSEETGLSVSFLSLVERDKVSISVDNLERLAQFYKVRLVHLFQDLEDSKIYTLREAQLKESLSVPGMDRTTLALLSRRHTSRMEPVLFRIGAGSADVHFPTHEGDIFLYVLEGKIRLLSIKDDDVESLEKGDTAYFSGYPPRRIENCDAEKPALLLLVTTPPASLPENALLTYSA